MTLEMLLKPINGPQSSIPNERNVAQRPQECMMQMGIHALHSSRNSKRQRPARAADRATRIVFNYLYAGQQTAYDQCSTFLARIINPSLRKHG